MIPNVLSNIPKAVIRTLAIIMVVLGLLWLFTKKPASVEEPVNTITLMESDIPISTSNCGGYKEPDTPALFAYFLETSLKEQLELLDIFENSDLPLDCAPGPFTLEYKNLNDMPQHQWTFTAMPAYFQWHLSKQENQDERFYITNQTGIPLPAHVTKLSKDNQSSLILVPKSPWAKDSLYYLYLIVETAQDKKTWIQPIMIVSED